MKYANELFVIGVHSAKFDTERATENVRAAVSRYNVNHPVVNDVQLRVMSAFAARAWPTLMFIDPEGKVIGRHEGEFQLDAMDRVLTAMIDEFDSAGVLKREAVPFEYGAEAESHGALSFPGKILAAGDDKLYIADSNHHRVIVASKDGEVSDIIGNGESPLAFESYKPSTSVLNPIGSDWSFDAPLFDNPQGMALDGEVLYVADAGTHTIQRVDMASRKVSVIAGTGEQSLIRHAGGEAIAFPLNSPYDLEYADGILYIADGWRTSALADGCQSRGDRAVRRYRRRKHRGWRTFGSVACPTVWFGARRQQPLFCGFRDQRYTGRQDRCGWTGCDSDWYRTIRVRRPRRHRKRRGAAASTGCDMGTRRDIHRRFI